MNKEIYTISEIKEKVEDIIKNYPVEKVYLFGSYARGEAKSTSDIDILLSGNNITSLLRLNDLYSDLEKTFGKKVDIVDASSLIENLNIQKDKYNNSNKLVDYLLFKTSENFYKELKKDRVLIYG